MDVSRYIHTFFFFFLEREKPESCLECQGQICHKDIIALGERTSVAFYVTCANEKRVRARSGENRRYDSIFGPFEKCSYFSSPGFLLYR